MSKQTRLAVAVVLLFCGLARAQFGPEDGPTAPKPADDAAAKLARQAYEQNLAQHGKDPNYFIRPGLMADKQAGTVRIWGKATAVSGNDPIEFFAIPADSGKDYEALSVAFTKASDVRSALEFIGMKPGSPVDATKNQYWPKGERVKMTFEWDQPPANGQGPAKATTAPAENLILDLRSNKPLPALGLVFTGSLELRHANGNGQALAADLRDARSIASDYNEEASILDVPRQATKGAVYSTQKLNPAYRFTPGQPLQIVLEPLHKDLKPRVHDATLSISIPPGGAPQAGKYELADANGKKLTDGDSLVHLLAAFGRLTDAGEDLFVTLKPDRQITLGSLQQVYALLGQMDTEQGIRIDSPPPGDLYYRAFFPDPRWRDRKNRLGRPWELHLVNKDRQLAGTLILPADEIDDNGGRGDLKFVVADPQQMARTLADNSDKFSHTVYIFAPSSITYGELLDFIAPSMKTHQMYVFLPANAPAQP